MDYGAGKWLAGFDWRLSRLCLATDDACAVGAALLDLAGAPCLARAGVDSAEQSHTT